MAQPENPMVQPRSKYHPKTIAKKIKVAIRRHNPFKKLSPDDPDARVPPTHTHTVCSICNTSVSYDVWDSCPLPPVHPEYYRTDIVAVGPCKHCVSDENGWKRLWCDQLRCERCWYDQGAAVVIARRDKGLLRRGYTPRKNDMWNWKAPRIDGGPDFAAPWQAVRCGPCRYVDPKWPARAKKEFEKEEIRQAYGMGKPNLNA